MFLCCSEQLKEVIELSVCSHWVPECRLPGSVPLHFFFMNAFELRMICGLVSSLFAICVIYMHVHHLIVL